MTLEIEQQIVELYQRVRKMSPAFINWKVTCHPDLFKLFNCQPGDLVTVSKIPIFPDLKLRVTNISDNIYQSDIWIIGKPRQRRKFRHYKR